MRGSKRAKFQYVTLTIILFLAFHLVSAIQVHSQGFDDTESAATKGTVQNSAKKWNPSSVKTQILGKPDALFFGTFDFMDGGYNIRQYESWKIIIAHKKDGGVVVTIDEGLGGRGVYQAKVIKVSKNEIIIEHPPVLLGFDSKKFVLQPGSTLKSTKIQSFTYGDGVWFSEDCWLKRVTP